MNIDTKRMCSSTEDKGVFQAFESCRGIAALMVAAFHCGQSRWSEGDLLFASYDREKPILGFFSYLYATVSNGQAGVVFFFVLSGFVLSLSADRSAIIDLPWVWRFVTRRLLRIYPAAVACIGIFVFVYVVSGVGIPGTDSNTFRLANIVSNFLMLRTDINGVMWTLQLEVLAIPMIALCIFLVRTNRTSFVVSLAFFLFCASFSGTWKSLFGPSCASLQPMYCFVIGVLVHAVGSKSKWVQLSSNSNLALVTSIILLLSTRATVGCASPWSPIVESLVAAYIIAHFVNRSTANTPRLLNHFLVRFLGKVSYSYYLLHPLTLIVLWRSTNFIEAFRQLGVPSSLVAILLVIASSLAVLPLAWLSWRFIEIPCMRFRIGTALSQELRVRRVHPAEATT